MTRWFHGCHQAMAAWAANTLTRTFFRMQLDTVFELADSMALYNPNTPLATYENNPGWWEALTEFYTYINTPTQFTITVTGINDQPYTQGIPDLLVPENTGKQRNQPLRLHP